MNASAPFETQKQIRFHHCDPAGIVFYPQYFVLMNELVEDWFNRGLGVDFARFHTEARRGIPMAHIECDFLAPSRIGETLSFGLWVEKIGDSSLRLAVEARGRRGDPRTRHARRRPRVARYAAGGAVRAGVSGEASRASFARIGGSVVRGRALRASYPRRPQPPPSHHTRRSPNRNPT
jgi:4-hydroxybenzoyl-CoA thioesterase